MREWAPFLCINYPMPMPLIPPVFSCALPLQDSEINVRFAVFLPIDSSALYRLLSVAKSTLSGSNGVLWSGFQKTSLGLLTRYWHQIRAQDMLFIVTWAFFLQTNELRRVSIVKVGEKRFLSHSSGVHWRKFSRAFLRVLRLILASGKGSEHAISCLICILLQIRELCGVSIVKVGEKCFNDS